METNAKQQRRSFVRDYESGQWSMRAETSPLPDKALQRTWRSAFQSRSGSLWAPNLGASATVGDLCHAAERPVR